MSRSLNREALLEQLDNDWEFLLDAIQLFNQNTASLIGRIRTALSQRDAESLAAAAHSCKGVASNFFAEAATAAAQELETKAKEGDLETAATAAKRLEAEVQKLRIALQELSQERAGNLPEV